MKFFIINSDYNTFIEKDYKNNPFLKNKSFIEQLGHRYDTFFGVSNFYSKNLKILGHDAIDIIINNKYIQRQWAKENNINTPFLLDFFCKIPYIGKYFIKKIEKEILRRQILFFKPEIVYNMAMESVGSKFFHRIKKELNVFIIGQHAASFSNSMNDLSAYNLIFSSLPNYVELFISKGIPSEYLPLAFEKSILEKISLKPQKKYDVVHIGGFSNIHKQRNELLEYLAKQEDFNIDFWGYGEKNLRKNSPILKKFHGFIGGLDMYNILTNAKICVNVHVDKVAGDFANNMRLFEATGVGTMLITDQKKNLNELFADNKEILTYSDKVDLVKKIKYFIKRDDEREKISKEGMAKTNNEHSYLKRMSQMLEILKKYYQVDL